MSDKYYTEYPTEPIGGGNPYHKCSKCGKSVPGINGRLAGHEEWCEWRKKIELKVETTKKLLEVKARCDDSSTGRLIDEVLSRIDDF